jgi:hypothetical protein
MRTQYRRVDGPVLRQLAGNQLGLHEPHEISVQEEVDEHEDDLFDPVPDGVDVDPFGAEGVRGSRR